MNNYLFYLINTMRKIVSIPSELINHANSKDIDEMLKILWDAVRYRLTWEIVDKWLLELLDPNLRRSKNMKWKQNRLWHTKNKSVTHLKISVWHTKNKSVTDLKKECNTLKIADTNWLNEEHEDKFNIIYSNMQLYDIVTKYIHDNNITYTLNYLIKKQWEEKFMNSQVEEAEKLIKKIWFERLKIILNYIPQDDFRCKNILSIAKLNKVNKDWVPYYIIIMDKIKQYRPKVISIPTV